MHDRHVQDTSIKVPGGHLFVRTWTPENARTARPLILLHDSLGCVGLWRDLPSQLAERLSCPVIAYDRLGFGKSSRAESLHTIAFIRDEAEIFFPAVRDALGIESYALLGHSVGGSMALTIAACDHSRCDCVVTEAAQAFVEDCTKSGIQAAWDQFKHPEQFQRLQKWHGEKADWVLRAWTDIWLSEKFANWSLAPTLRQVDCPVLVIHGDQDEFGSTAFPEMIGTHTRGPTTIEILAGCGHVPHRERASEFLGHLSKFMR